ncbi:chemotaxis protein CheW [Pelagibaculum spongiae]|uniref:Chemotaxis protein CheW n=1 Tax=Pelagibaculum spongiae TaxID=2080658 RepID=A0A2V1GYM2_9GAMM|nr:chemotaxis protein CheW [Pelagibaculum spongiae]PVZ72164.1 chemotaxis protein CheW [Pelagibaculum spongiae]
MRQISGQSAFEILKAVEAGAKQYAVPLPRQQAQGKIWSGVGFRLGDQLLMAPLNEVSEILYPMPLSRLPGTRNWLKGIANLRGQLIPVMDLSGFFGGVPVKDRGGRILVLNYEGGSTGLLVNQVLGLQHFEEKEAIDSLSLKSPALARCIQGGFERHGQIWPVFSPHALSQHPDFRRVALG